MRKMIGLLALATVCATGQAQPTQELQTNQAMAMLCVQLADLSTSISRARASGLDAKTFIPKSMETTSAIYYLEQDILMYAATKAAGPNDAWTYAVLTCKNNIQTAYHMAANGGQMRPQDIKRHDQ